MTGNSDKPPVIFLMGPTASGKTGLAIELARQFPVEIISVDSSLVYRGMDIGTAKPTAQQCALAPHRLVDIREPNEPYSAADFCGDALREIREVHARGKIPLLVGGTIFYFHSLEFGLSKLPAADTGVRRRLQQEIEEKGLAMLHERLCEVDPESGKRIHANDTQRIERALEIFELTGQTLTELGESGDIHEFPYSPVKLALWVEDRKDLNPRIEQRFQQMLDDGLVAETESLLKKDWFDPNLPSMRMVGYRQVIEYLQGRYDYNAMRDKAVIATGQLAKRQMTWIRGYPGMDRLNCLDRDLTANCLRHLSGKLSDLGI